MVDGTTFKVSKGSITGLIGPNGAGKTTCFNCIAGKLQPDSGEVIFQGKRITGLPSHKVFRYGLHRTFQIPQPFERLTVLENLLLPPKKQLGERLFMPFIMPHRVRRQEKILAKKALRALQLVELDGLSHERAEILSGGQRKLLELARALIDKPRMILLDEPTAGVNPVLSAKICEYLQRTRNETGVTLLLVSHDMAAVERVCDNVIVMANGRVLTEGLPSEVIDNPVVQEVYLGGSNPR